MDPNNSATMYRVVVVYLYYQFCFDHSIMNISRDLNIYIFFQSMSVDVLEKQMRSLVLYGIPRSLIVMVKRLMLSADQDVAR